MSVRSVFLSSHDTTLPMTSFLNSNFNTCWRWNYHILCGRAWNSSIIFLQHVGCYLFIASGWSHKVISDDLSIVMTLVFCPLDNQFPEVYSSEVFHFLFSLCPREQYLNIGNSWRSSKETMFMHGNGK